ncbi:hypothetical protein ASPFODRAFT_55598 [Aspergillus luchuensis CBS 106.47]|uniref:Uncharacterized protein n=1 Tax=Aspergillus luchuensis (strain CBS 106.47) TaxID=1137211 RepID=A0A1M3TYT9_ASPLC|nr:hypothetical protein ASPFODRAFT_55598 [Aspergillus luchuensis CBS 106.47]
MPCPGGRLHYSWQRHCYTTHSLYLNPGSGSKAQLPSTGIATTLLHARGEKYPRLLASRHNWVLANPSPVLLAASDRRLALLRSKTGIHRTCLVWRHHPCDCSTK